MALLSNFRNSFTGAVMLGAAAAVSFAPTTADAQDQQVAASPSDVDVRLMVGDGFSRSAANGVAGNLIARGCTVSVEQNGPAPNLLVSQTASGPNFFTQDETGDALVILSRECG